MTALIDRLRRCPPVAPPTGPQPPAPEDLERARSFLAAVARYEQARLAKVGPRGDLDAATGRLGAAREWRSAVEKRDGDFIFRARMDLGDERAPARRVRREVVETKADEDLARAEQDVQAAELSLATADIALSLALRGVVADLNDAPAAEQLLAFESSEAARVLAGAEADHAAARRTLGEACTAASAAPRPRTLDSILASRHRPSTPEVVHAEGRVAAAEESRRHAAREVGRVQEQTRLLDRVVAVALAAERESLDRAAERAAIESETYRRRDR